MKLIATVATLTALAVPAFAGVDALPNGFAQPETIGALPNGFDHDETIGVLPNGYGQDERIGYTLPNGFERPESLIR